MEFITGKTYVTQCDGKDDSSTQDFFSKGERWVFQSYSSINNAYFRREGTSSGGRENELLISKLRFDEVFGEPKTFEVEEDFIKAAHRAACSEWKTKIEAKFPEVFPKEVTYKKGDRFRKIGGYFDGDEYILARSNSNTLVLINLTSGNRWSKPIKVKNLYMVTLDEWKLIIDGEVDTFELIK